MSRKSGLVGALAALIYATLWLGVVRQWDWMRVADGTILAAFHAHGAPRPGWVSTWDWISTLLGPAALRVVAVVVIVVAWVRRDRPAAAFVGLCVLGMGLVTVAAKALSDRPRPDTALTVASSTAFPSGHALGVMAAMLAFVTVAWPLIAARFRLAAIAGSVGVVVLVGVSRVVLNVHHPSDVVAGWALGYLWFLLCVRLLPPDRRPRA